MHDWDEAGNGEQYRVGERLWVKSGTAWEEDWEGMNVKSCFFKRCMMLRRAWNLVYWKVKTGADI